MLMSLLEDIGADYLPRAERLSVMGNVLFLDGNVLLCVDSEGVLLTEQEGVGRFLYEVQRTAEGRGLNVDWR